jgi:hypothetical protein
MSTDLPPEAYTRETLQAAFDWLQTQPEVLRASVHTPERLVSLYQKSQRLNDLDHPVSSKKFVTDLKNLASSLDQFSDISSPTTPAPENKIKDKIQENLPPVPDPVSSAATMTFDDKTQTYLSRVRERFNLSSDNEALRLLVSLGYEKFSQFD